MLGWAKPKTPAVESGGDGGPDRTLSRSCLVSKRKNFVSRAQGPLRCAPCPFPPGVSEVSWPSFLPASASPHALVERLRSVPLTQLPDKPTYRAQCTSCDRRGRLRWRSFKL
jgi:hypothetical protein